MSCLRGYSEFLKSLNEDDRLRSGIVVDTSILISATNEVDHSHEQASDFLELVADEKVPMYCNVIIRSEFLEIHRRLIFSEAIFEFARTTEKSKLPAELTKKVERWLKLAPNDQSPIPKFRLSESDIKDVKRFLIGVFSPTSDAWALLCRDLVGNKIGAVWEGAVEDLGLNFLSTRNAGASTVLSSEPIWENAVAIMETLGIGSADALILNMFFASNLRAIVTSDFEIAHAVNSKRPERICFVPDKMLNELRAAGRPRLLQAAERVDSKHSDTFRRLAN